MTKVKVIVMIDYGDIFDDRYEKKEWEFNDIDMAEELYDELLSYVCLPEREVR